MGHRLSKIYTRTGDDGTTGLADGSRVAKHDARIEAVGNIDEVNSAIGLILAEISESDELSELLNEVQHDLFEIGAELAMPEYRSVRHADILRLESGLDKINVTLPPLKEFVLPGGNRAAAACHLARTICRRAERRVWALAEHTATHNDVTSYLNRLSDLLFVAARSLARRDGGAETLWQRDRG